MTILNKIIAKIQEDNVILFNEFSKSRFSLNRKPINILQSIQENFFVIAECKKASPSKGIIRKDYQPLEIAKSYEKAGANAISVITEKNFFQGSLKDLKEVKARINLPILRKDFIIHKYQIAETYKKGADIILLIVACLSNEELVTLFDYSQELSLNVLVEIHNEKELKQILKVLPNKGFILGINNRNLENFEVNFNQSFLLKDKIQALLPNIPVISESGIKTNVQVNQLKAKGFAGILVGESLLKQKDAEKALKELIF